MINLSKNKSNYTISVQAATSLLSYKLHLKYLLEVLVGKKDSQKFNDTINTQTLNLNTRGKINLPVSYGILVLKGPFVLKFQFCLYVTNLKHKNYISKQYLFTELEMLKTTI